MRHLSDCPSHSQALSRREPLVTPEAHTVRRGAGATTTARPARRIAWVRRQRDADLLLHEALAQREALDERLRPLATRKEGPPLADLSAIDLRMGGPVQAAEAHLRARAPGRGRRTRAPPIGAAYWSA